MKKPPCRLLGFSPVFLVFAMVLLVHLCRWLDDFTSSFQLLNGHPFGVDKFPSWMGFSNEVSRASRVSLLQFSSMAGGGWDSTWRALRSGVIFGWKNRGIFKTIFQGVRGEKIEIVKVGSHLKKGCWKSGRDVTMLLTYYIAITMFQLRRLPTQKGEFSSSAMSKDLKSNHDHPWSTSHLPCHDQQVTTPWLPVVDPAVRPCMTSTPTPTSFQRAFSKDLYGPIPRCLGGEDRKSVV